uniref:Ribosomal protein S6-2 n=1 Tax=Salmo salar TaxID=8030 RepID=M4VHQ0_SALSA|nr:ribosomal protein S6-2 [Salmo salar]
MMSASCEPFMRSVWPQRWLLIPWEMSGRREGHPRPDRQHRAPPLGTQEGQQDPQALQLGQGGRCQAVCCEETTD